MSDIEVVIKIPEEIHQDIMNYKPKDKFQQTVIYQLLKIYIRKGVPLPKGHGRIGDLDALRCENTDFDTYNDYCIMFDEIEAAETIIGADKLESKDKE